MKSIMVQLSFRSLKSDDYNKGFLQLLEQLTVVDAETISYEKFCKRLSEINSYVYVIEDLDSNKLVATASLLIEKKFIHGLSSVGHIEDVVVDKDSRNMGIGNMMISNLVDIAKQNGCYKMILDCSESNISFYKKCGFVVKELQMVKYS